MVGIILKSEYREYILRVQCCGDIFNFKLLNQITEEREIGREGKKVTIFMDAFNKYSRI